MSHARLLTFCAIAVLLSSVVLFAQGKPQRGKVDIETRVRDLEKTVAELLERVERIESRGSNKLDAVPAGVPSLQALADGKATILAEDGTFLGIISDDTFNTKSISNSVGSHGSEVGSASIFNDIGKYGSSVSALSARNDLASRPPKVYLNDKFVGFLTINPLKSPRIDTDALIAYLKSRR